MGVELHVLLAYGLLISGPGVDKRWEDKESEDMDDASVYSMSLYTAKPEDKYLFALAGTEETIMDRKISMRVDASSGYGRPREPFALQADDSVYADKDDEKVEELLRELHAQIDGSEIPVDLKAYVKENGEFGKWLYAYYH